MTVPPPIGPDDVRRGARTVPTRAEVERFHAALSRASSPPGILERVLRSAIRAGCRLFAFRVEVSLAAGLPQPPGQRRGAGCLVVAAPHRAWLEPFLVMIAWPGDAARLVWLADGRTVTRSWWRRRILPLVGVIPIEGDPRALPTYARLAGMVLAAGAALVVFPETGPPSPPSRTRRISPGFAYLAAAAGAPVVPVVIAGTHRIVRGSTFRVTLLEAMEGGPAVVDPFASGARRRAHELSGRYAATVNGVLAGENASTDARAPRRARWRWLGRLFR